MYAYDLDPIAGTPHVLSWIAHPKRLAKPLPLVLREVNVKLQFPDQRDCLPAVIRSRNSAGHRYREFGNLPIDPDASYSRAKQPRALLLHTSGHYHMDGPKCRCASELVGSAGRGRTCESSSVDNNIVAKQKAPP